MFGYNFCSEKMSILKVKWYEKMWKFPGYLYVLFTY